MSISTECKYPITVEQDNIKHEVRCGKCPPCNVYNYYILLTRLKWVFKKARTGMFATLTYNDNNLPLVETVDKDSGEISIKDTVVKDHATKFLHRVRDLNRNAHKKRPQNGWPRLKYYLCAEYGTETLRPHYHVIIFNYHPDIKYKILDSWKSGNTQNGNVEGEAGIKYALKDMTKQYNISTKLVEEQEKPFRLMSNGIGIEYVEANKKNHIKTDERYIRAPERKKLAMGRYLTDKIFPKKTFSIQEIQEQREESQKRKDETHQEAVKLGFENIHELRDNREETKQRRNKFFGKKTL